MIDYDLVRAYYFDPPPRDPERVPSDEELIARYERRRVEDCIRRGGASSRQGGISLYEIARALHAARIRRPDLVRWINRFAVRPKPTA